MQLSALGVRAGGVWSVSANETGGGRRRMKGYSGGGGGGGIQWISHHAHGRAEEDNKCHVRCSCIGKCLRNGCARKLVGKLHIRVE